MPDRRKKKVRSKKAASSEADDRSGPLGLWSGALAFGLVNIPVRLFSANRSSGPGLRMLAPDGAPLRRVYTCSSEGTRLDRDDIVRGYELDDGRFVRVTDEELEALEPEKSRLIDLRRFVPVADIDPVFFERGYFLVPEKDALKAYRLLARTMEESERAGIATFVMRGKEYLVAILSEGGLLRAETMRFHDEVRTPKDLRLATSATAGRSAPGAGRMEKAIRELSSTRLDREELADLGARRLSDLVRKKLDAGKDVLEGSISPEDEDEDGGEPIDIMEVLKESLRRAAAAKTARKPAKRRARAEPAHRA